ncbi:MAG TPA: tetratricopeptide repeat protein [Rhizomicrobium sp.]|jgi:hypothetical protein|nr:tetratricopeptide repeat protein [Rhizomicrobium sp.]
MTGPVDSALYHAITHHQAGRLDQAIQLYRQVLAAQPGLVEAHNNLGIALAEKGNLAEAVACYRHALSLAPHRTEILVNLGNALYGQRALAEAAAAYRRALEIAPDDAGALHGLGNLLLRETSLPGSSRFGGERIDESFACFAQYAPLAFGTKGAPQEPPMPHRLRHDREQSDYLGGNGKFHLADGGRLSLPAVNPEHRNDIEELWRTQRPQIVVIDNFLTDAALEKLRRFCWESTIWRRPHADGYLTALPEFGLACPLLAQIAAELYAAYPSIFRAHPLRYLWGFKYDSTLSGVGVHADQAAVNVNFWITPDEANLDPNSGGLVIWDIAAPLTWNFSRYNGDVAAARDFLARSGAKPVRVPHRANRAVIFDSDLFHETDRMTFRPGYLNRRINITLLYGARADRS